MVITTTIIMQIYTQKKINMEKIEVKNGHALDLSV